MTPYNFTKSNNTHFLKHLSNLTKHQIQFSENSLNTKQLVLKILDSFVKSSLWGCQNIYTQQTKRTTQQNTCHCSQNGSCCRLGFSAGPSLGGVPVVVRVGVLWQAWVLVWLALLCYPSLKSCCCSFQLCVDGDCCVEAEFEFSLFVFIFTSCVLWTPAVF